MAESTDLKGPQAREGANEAIVDPVGKTINTIEDIEGNLAMETDNPKAKIMGSNDAEIEKMRRQLLKARARRRRRGLWSEAKAIEEEKRKEEYHVRKKAVGTGRQGDPQADNPSIHPRQVCGLQGGHG